MGQTVASKQLASNKNFQNHMTRFPCSRMPKQRSRSAHTVAAYRDAISLFLVYMRDERGIPANKMTLHDFTAEAVKTVLAEALKGNLRDLALLQLLYDSGCRVGELIDLNPNSIALRGPSENSTVYLVGKGKKSRIVGISPLTALHLGEHLKRRGKNCKPSDPLFTNQKNERLTRGGVAYILSKYVNVARKENPEVFPSWHVTPHTMRHSRATH